MKKLNLAVCFALGLALLAGGPVMAAEKAAAGPATKAVQGAAMAATTAAETFVDGCEKELTTYCKDVTPGEARVLACLYAHIDKISPRCEYAVYDSAAQLERMLNNLSFVVNECGDDLEKLCADVKPGGGRLADCLDKNKDKVSKRCSQALTDVDKKK